MSEERIKALFQEALDTPPEGRARFLASACAGEPGVRSEIEGLLRDHDAAGAFLAEPTGGGVDRGDLDPPPGSDIGPYRLLGRIGEGGFGVVYVAEQSAPVRRRVALKVLKAGLDTREVVARFEAERQALALMEHPHIARVFDGGSTATGRPYFVMELVDGTPIQTYCDEHRLPLRDRLALFARVCRAVQHAHQKGIIHRDLKPSNVLVVEQDGAPQPKVIDFGVAKATGTPLTDASIHTHVAQLIGTPQYMSPEQVALRGIDIDTRSDIYALGVLLYELLTGSTPFADAPGSPSTFDELRRRIQDVDPPTPSAQLTRLNGDGARIAAARASDVRRLARTLKGELDWIVMKALEKDRARRYATANDLADDVERYLADEPVAAGPPSRWYRAKKLARRHRTAFGLLVVGLLVLGWAVTTWRAAQRRAVRISADVDAARLEAVRLREAAWARADRPADWKAGLAAAEAAHERARALATAADVALDPAVLSRMRQLARDLAQDVRDRSALLALEAVQGRRLLEALQAVGPEERVEPYRTALAEQGVDPSGGSPSEAATHIADRRPPVRRWLIEALDEWIVLAAAERAEELAWLRQTVAIADEDPFRGRVRAAADAGERDALVALARQDDALEQPIESLRLLARALATVAAYDAEVQLLSAARDVHPDDAFLHIELGSVLALQLDRPEEAAAAFRVGLAIRPDDAVIWVSLNYALDELGQYEAALRAIDRAIALRPTFAEAHVNRGVTLAYLGRHEEAREAYRRALDLDPTVRHAHEDIGDSYLDQGEVDAAREAYEAAVRQQPGSAQGHSKLGRARYRGGDVEGAVTSLRRALALGLDDFDTHFDLAVALRRQGDKDGALRHAQRASELGRDSAAAWSNLGACLTDHGELVEARTALERALDLDPDHADAHQNFAVLLDLLGDPAGALEHALAAKALAPERSSTRLGLGSVLLTLGRIDDAVEELRAACEMNPEGGREHGLLGVGLYRQGDVGGALHHLRKGARLAPGEADLHYNLACLLAETGEVVEAIASYEKAIDLAPRYAQARVNLGNLLVAQGRIDEAITQLERAVELDDGLAEAHANLGVALHARGDAEGAIAHLERAVALNPAFAWALGRLGMVLALEDRPDEARARWSDLLALRALHPQVANELAWTLATSEDARLRDPERAVGLARRAVRLAPTEAGYRTTLGIALYRAGAHEDAVRALEHSTEGPGGATAYDGFFLAMARHALGDAAGAREAYERAVDWAAAHAPDDPDLGRFQAEAAERLGLTAR